MEKENTLPVIEEQPDALSLAAPSGKRLPLSKSQNCLDDASPGLPAGVRRLPLSKSQAALDDAAAGVAPPKSKPANPLKAINVGVASRALFNLESDINTYDDEEKLRGYLKAQLEHEQEPFQPGSAFPFIQALETVNASLLKINPDEQELFNVVLMSHNHAQVGVRLIRSINYHNLNIERMCLTGGGSPVPDYLAAYNIALFLTSYPEEVELALKYGFAAAAMTTQKVEEPIKNQLRVAFDLDAVLFSDEAERQYKAHGLQAFFAHEKVNVDKPLDEGPLKGFATALGRIQAKFRRGRSVVPQSPLRVYIVTARSAASAGERALKTLRAWGLDVDEMHFLAGAPKGPVLRAIKPHLFFDDQHSHILSAQEFGMPGAHVRSGIANELREKHRAAYRRNMSVMIECSPPPEEDEDGEDSESAAAAADERHQGQGQGEHARHAAK